MPPGRARKVCAVQLKSLLITELKQEKRNSEPRKYYYSSGKLGEIKKALSSKGTVIKSPAGGVLLRIVLNGIAMKMEYAAWSKHFEQDADLSTGQPVVGKYYIYTLCNGVKKPTLTRLYRKDPIEVPRELKIDTNSPKEIFYPTAALTDINGTYVGGRATCTNTTTKNICISIDKDVLLAVDTYKESLKQTVSRSRLITDALREFCCQKNSAPPFCADTNNIVDELLAKLTIWRNNKKSRSADS